MSEPNIIVFDCETTGTDKSRDQIIEVCIQRGLRGSAITWRIKPSVSIHPDAQGVHGITAEDLEHCPTFAELADTIVAELAVADVIVGYNVAFDLEMLYAELVRAGKAQLDTSRKLVVDAYRLWQQCEPRKLQDAHQRFVGEAFEGAHAASADVAATGRVLEGMLDAFGLAGESWDRIARRADPELGTWLEPSRKLKWKDGVVVFAFGKHAGAAVHEIAGGPDRSFLTWILSKDFGPAVKEVCDQALRRSTASFLAWVAERFPPPAAPTEAAHV
jgi:DNA polymerase-3 subunit epsilon